jgi:hypothetical protein
MVNPPPPCTRIRGGRGCLCIGYQTLGRETWKWNSTR